MNEADFTANYCLLTGRAVVLTCRCGHRGELDLLALQLHGRGDDPLLAIFDRKGFVCTRCGSHVASMKAE